ncbi:hypothetical protein [Shimia sp. MMG029]|uniref:hypothetical protein n=1 Tax=Shimia sp. MMG029 TaxID=3021978 RepID=UPI0022FF2875|nr:hypothetical protein [Shimia sp. MMG029]MDA5556441.1 hypothetical protein [Shimia sp. MMG029]
MVRYLVVITFIAAMAAAPVLSCAFHGYTPIPTMVERLMSSSSIVLARSHAETPFRFTDVRALRGAAGEAVIPHMVDSKTRAFFEKSPEARVLFAKDSQTGAWVRLVNVDQDMHRVLRQILAHLVEWKEGDTAGRAEFFAALLDEEDPELHNLALGELDLLDYSTFRKLGLQVDTKRILSRIHVVGEANLKPVRVLLLGLSEEVGLRAFFQEGVRANARSDGPMLGAYAIALMEYEGRAAVDWLVRTLLTNQEVSAQALSVLVGTMALHHGAGSEEVGAAIRENLARVAIVDARISGLVNSHFALGIDPKISPHFMTLETVSRLAGSNKF